MKAKDVMSREVRLARPDQAIQDAAKTMADIDAGIIPVATRERLVGMLTDRDITVRAVAKGLSPSTPVAQVMSADVKYCFDDDDLEDVAANMAKIQVRRLPVLDRNKRLVGIIALADLAKQREYKAAGQAIHGISAKGGQHSQSTAA